MIGGIVPGTPMRPGATLHGFVGGIVSNANTASRLAQIILETLIGPRNLASCLPLRAQDCGDRWSVSGAGELDAGRCRIDIHKPDAAILSLGVEAPPEVLDTAEIAEKFAAVLAEQASDKTVRQAPFTVTDRGDTWLVRGSYNADRAVEGRGPFQLEVRKRDAAVIDMFSEAVIHTPPEVIEALRRKK